MARGPYLGRGLLGILLIVGLGLFLGRSSDTAGAASAVGDARLRQTVSFGNVAHRNRSSSFRGGDATVVMGALDLDLTRATMEGPEVVIEIATVMGRTDIRVPENWEIVSEVETVLGRTDDRTDPGAVKDRRLVLRGEVVMGHLEVRN
jgi:predicted membrane protein